MFKTVIYISLSAQHFLHCILYTKFLFTDYIMFLANNLYQKRYHDRKIMQPIYMSKMYKNKINDSPFISFIALIKSCGSLKDTNPKPLVLFVRLSLTTFAF